jgi:hypothetical protein
MRSLRRALADKLVESGTQLALDRQEMLRNARNAGVRSLDSRSMELLLVLELLSSAKIKLGFLLMPRRLPDADRGA